MSIYPKRFRRIVVVLFIIAIVTGWLGNRLGKTYLPESENNVASRYCEVNPNTANIRRAAGEMKTLQEQILNTVPAVLPSVVAITTPDSDPSARTRYQSNYGSGVIITADGIVLSQWHVSHWKKSESGGETTQASRASFSAGDQTTVILHDGRKCRAELLGANRSHDISLLRLLEPGPFHHVPIDVTTSIQIGDWLLKFGHPLGYRNGRSAPVRLGRVISGTGDIFGTDCMWAGGDSGGPYFSLNGQLLGIMRDAPLQEVMGPDVNFVKRTNGNDLMRVTGGKLIHSLLDAMIRGEIADDELRERARVDHELATSPRLQAADYSQGSRTLAQYQSSIESNRTSVVEVLSAGVVVSLGTIVDREGVVITKASELPDKPTCRLAGGKVVPAQVVEIDAIFDLAILLVPAMDLMPVNWADEFNHPAGTIVAALGPTGLPLAVGVVSVQRRDLNLPRCAVSVEPSNSAAGHPGIYGDFQPISGYSLYAAFGQPRPTAFRIRHAFGLAWSAGVRPEDMLCAINGCCIQSERDIMEAIAQKRVGDVVPIRLERDRTVIDLQLPLGTDTGFERSDRRDDFPTVIECAVPFYSYECGGPVVDLSGRTIGVTIAKLGPHGGMIIPGDYVLELLRKSEMGFHAKNATSDNPLAK